MRFVELFVLALLATAAKADPVIPDYQYFYHCDSGVVDCSAFPKHQEYSGPPVNALQPVNFEGGFFDHGQYAPMYSNSHGQSIGFVTVFGPGGIGDRGGVAYGDNGVVTCLTAC